MKSMIEKYNKIIALKNQEIETHVSSLHDIKEEQETQQKNTQQKMQNLERKISSLSDDC